MNIRTQLINNPINVKEQFWHKHIQLKQSSMLSRAAYCRNNKLNADQFGYWEQKLTLKLVSQSSDLLPVKLVSTKQEDISPQNPTATLCTLAFKSGNVLTVHDKSVIPALLSMLG
jgi:hypothetical protein